MLFSGLRNLVRTVRRRPGRAVLAVALVVLIALCLYPPGRLLWASAQLGAARAALNQRDFGEARLRLTNYLRVHPNSHEAHLLMAQAARRAGFLDEAERQLDICRRLEGDTEAAELERTLGAVQQGDLSARAELWARVRQEPADGVLILEALARGYRKNYLLQPMLKALDGLLERQPDHLDALLERGWVRERLFDLTRAVDDYRRALALDPHHEGARLNLAEALLRDGQARAAEPHFREVRRGRPGNWAAGLGLARCWRKMGRTDEARRLLDELTARHPEEAPLLLERGRLALEQGRREEAEGWLRRAVNRAPYDYQANYAFSMCLNQGGDSSEAREWRARLQRVEADTVRLNTLTDRLQKRPFDPDLRCAIGRTWMRNGKEREGVLWLHSALRADPRHRPTHRALADYYEQKQQPAQAARHRELAGGG